MLSALHPLPKLAICLAWIAASVLIFDAGFQLATILIAAGSLILIERRSPLLVLGLMIPLALFGFGFLTTSLLFREEADFATRMAGETPFGGEALSAGLVLFLRAIACGMVSAVFALTTEPGSLIKSLMRDCGLSPRVGYALFSALHLVPDLVAEARQAQLARAMRKGRPARRIPGPVEGAGLIIPLLAYAIRRANRSAVAMEARGLGGASPRTIVGAPRLGKRDAIFTALALGLLAASALPAIVA